MKAPVIRRSTDGVGSTAEAIIIIMITYVGTHCQCGVIWNIVIVCVTMCVVTYSVCLLSGTGHIYIYIHDKGAFYFHHENVYVSTG